MAQRILATSDTNAINAGSQVSFSLQAKHFRDGKKPVLSVKGLGNGETVSFWKWIVDTWEEVATEAGVQVSFSPTRASDVFNGPGVYGYTKTATVAPITLTLDDGL